MCICFVVAPSHGPEHAEGIRPRGEHMLARESDFFGSLLLG